MTMNDIPQAPTTWCDPDDVGAPLPETDEVEADPQTVQIPPAESFEVLRRASEEELRAQERGEQLNPLESGRAAITIALTPLCQLEGAVMLGALLGVIPLILLFLGLQRFWQAGLAAGAVKG